jgi:polyhydroxybutyrate depolymerase
MRGVRVLLVLPLALVLGEALAFHVTNRSNGTLISSGVEREYLLHVPKSVDPSKPAPLVISMHGAGLWPASQMETSRWNELSDEQGFLVVYPGGSGLPRVFHVDRGAALERDVRFVSDLIDELEARYRIDSARIYANGLSNGGGMSFVLSCALSRRIAAVGLVASAQTLPWSWCTERRPVPMISFHGTGDRYTPYEGGESFMPNTPIFPSVTSWTSSWARRNRCAPNPVRSAVAADVTKDEYVGCAEDASVVLYTIRGGGHTWPGGKPLPEWAVGRTSTGIDATRTMWEFFRAHPMPR